MQLRGCNAILTGASRGLGVFIARALAREGVNLALAARSLDEIERLGDELAKEGIRAIAIRTDVADVGQLHALVTEAERDLGPIDILVNNAGVEFGGPHAERAIEDIETEVRVNLFGPLVLTRLVLPGMLERGRGHIVHVSSLAGLAGSPYEAVYGATKGGLNMFNRSLRVELASTPVGCSVVCPGFVSGEGMWARSEALGFRVPRLAGKTTPEKVAEAVVKAVKSNAPELIVNPQPLRPLLALGQAFPAAVEVVQKISGAPDLLREISAARKDAAL